jgi:uncharacterized protein (DUF2147 family)
MRTCWLRAAGVAIAWMALSARGMAAPPDAAGDPAVGRWKTPVHDGIVEISRCGASICGRLVTSSRLAVQPDMRDTHNADAALRQRRLIGIMLLQGFTRSADAWVGGTIYDPDDGRTYHARVTPQDNDHLRVRGCVFVPLCQSQIWVRVR